MSANGTETTRDLAVVLHDLAWLLPRTVGAPAAREEPLPPTELEIMRLLTRRSGLSLSEVARELSLRTSNASAAVRSLVERGTLRRVPDPADKRVTRLEPTPAALAARERREVSWADVLDTSLGQLRPADAVRLRAAVPALRRLAEQLATTV